jgi:hypothetical protein
MDQPVGAPRSALPDILAGVALGSLFGLLLGLSVAQTVAGVIAALAAVLAGFFGLADRPFIGSPERIAGFGFAALLAIVLGVSLRAQDSLSRTPEAAVARWTAAGFSPGEAQALVAFERLGIRPAGREVAALPQPGRATALFAGAAAGECQRLAGIQDAQELLAQFEALGGNWAQLVPALRAAPQAASLVRDLACGGR